MPNQFSNFSPALITGGAGGIGTALNPTDVTVHITTGSGAEQPTSFPFQMVIGNPAGGVSATEIVTATASAGTDAFTITRHQEGTAAQTWPVATAIFSGATAFMLNSLNIPYNVVLFGADRTGATDAAPAIRAAVTAAGLSGHVIVPPGTYLLKGPIDFSTLLSGGNAYTFKFECMGGVTFLQDSSFTSGAMFNIVGPTGFQFLNCVFKLGTFQGQNNAANPVVAVNVRYFNDGVLEVERVVQFLGNAGILIDCSGSPTFGVFNNYMRFGALNNNKQAFITNGNPGIEGFQGNTVIIQHAESSTTDQVVVDQNGTGNTSKNNTFICGAIEHGSAAGVVDHTGQNIWIIADTNNNVNGGFLNASTTNSPLVMGTLEETVSAGIIGSALWPRWISAQDVNANKRGWNVVTPGVPAGLGSANAVTNTNPFSVRVVQSGGAGQHIVHPGGVFAGAGDVLLVTAPSEFILDPGAKVYYATTVCGGWNWYGQII